MATTCWNFWFDPSGLVWLGWAGQAVLTLKPQMKQTNQTEKNSF